MPEFPMMADENTEPGSVAFPGNVNSKEAVMGELGKWAETPEGAAALEGLDQADRGALLGSILSGAKQESSHDEGAVGPPDATGEPARGLFQWHSRDWESHKAIYGMPEADINSTADQIRMTARRSAEAFKRAKSKGADAATAARYALAEHNGGQLNADAALESGTLSDADLGKKARETEEEKRAGEFAAAQAELSATPPEEWKPLPAYAESIRRGKRDFTGDDGSDIDLVGLGELGARKIRQEADKAGEKGIALEYKTNGGFGVGDMEHGVALVYVTPSGNARLLQDAREAPEGVEFSVHEFASGELAGYGVREADGIIRLRVDDSFATSVRTGVATGWSSVKQSALNVAAMTADAMAEWSEEDGDAAAALALRARADGWRGESDILGEETRKMMRDDKAVPPKLLSIGSEGDIRISLAPRNIGALGVQALPWILPVYGASVGTTGALRLVGVSAENAAVVGGWAAAGVAGAGAGGAVATDARELMPSDISEEEKNERASGAAIIGGITTLLIQQRLMPGGFAGQGAVSGSLREGLVEFAQEPTQQALAVWASGDVPTALQMGEAAVAGAVAGTGATGGIAGASATGSAAGQQLMKIAGVRNFVETVTGIPSRMRDATRDAIVVALAARKTAARVRAEGGGKKEIDAAMQEERKRVTALIGLVRAAGQGRRTEEDFLKFLLPGVKKDEIPPDPVPKDLQPSGWMWKQLGQGGTPEQVETHHRFLVEKLAPSMARVRALLDNAPINAQVQKLNEIQRQILANGVAEVPPTGAAAPGRLMSADEHKVFVKQQVADEKAKLKLEREKVQGGLGLEKPGKGAKPKPAAAPAEKPEATPEPAPAPEPAAEPPKSADKSKSKKKSADAAEPKRAEPMKSGVEVVKKGEFYELGGGLY